MRDVELSGSSLRSSPATQSQPISLENISPQINTDETQIIQLQMVKIYSPCSQLIETISKLEVLVSLILHLHLSVPICGLYSCICISVVSPT